MAKPSISNEFQQVFFTVVILTLTSGATLIFFAQEKDPSPYQNRVFETCAATWQMGVGAIFGLLGGKAADLLQSENEQAMEEEGDE
ncbi:hypothetical protein Lepto7375DRAFT_0029 [Leptolyngbya sp. PCC 7375]|nr:hypothetical protein Lepto7375DRAFT_0029 [Leptolyngbya sp. PCC 7375]